MLQHICTSGHKTCDVVLPSSSPSFFLSRAANENEDGTFCMCHTLIIKKLDHTLVSYLIGHFCRERPATQLLLGHPKSAGRTDHYSTPHPPNQSSQSRDLNICELVLEVHQSVVGTHRLLKLTNVCTHLSYVCV